jgi:hypothetical protein
LNNNLNNDNIDGNLNPDLSSNLNSNLNPGINSNLSLNANNSILVQYQEGTMESLLSSANNGNQQLAYFKTVNDLSQLNPNKINLDSIANSSKHWDKTTRGLTTASQVLIAVAAVAVAVGTGGLGSGISGAMMTAVATTASTTATISATNASMNTDSNFLNSTNSIADSSWKATTSDESLKNMAISAAVAGAGYGVGEWMKNTKINYNNSITPEQANLGKESVSTGQSNLMPGSATNNKVGVNVVQRTNLQTGELAWFQEGTNIKVSQNYAYTAGNQNPVFQGFNTTPGAPSFADFHDALNLTSPWNELSIPPAYVASQFNALAPYYPIIIKYETNKK